MKNPAHDGAWYFRSLAITFLASVLVLAVLAGRAVQAGPQAKSGNAIDRVLQDAVDQKKIPGLVVMAADARGTIHQGAYGKRDTITNAPMELDSIFQIASMTKPITSVAVMQLVERGRVKLDKPASTYLPELSRLQVLEGFDDSGKPKLRPARTSPTVRQLLSHTSGFGYEFFNASLQRYAATGAIPSAMADDDGFLKAPLLFDPGARFEYGINTDWLGKLVEKVSGQTLEAYFRENIFKPLGMNDTFFDVPAEKQARVVALHTRQPNGGLKQAPRQPFQPVRFFSGGGGLFSTAGDYLKFARMMLGKGTLAGKRILRPETVALMSRNQISDLELPQFRSLAPQFANDPIRIPGAITKFGLGFGINTKEVEGRRAAGSLAWAGIFSTYFWIDPRRQTCGVLMSQVLPFSDEAVNATFEDFERAVYLTLGLRGARP